MHSVTNYNRGSILSYRISSNSAPGALKFQTPGGLLESWVLLEGGINFLMVIIPFLIGDFEG